MFLSKSSTLVWNWKSAHIYESSDKYARSTMDHNPKHSKGILTRINTTQEWEEIERKFQWQKCSSRKDASFILTWKSAHINESSDKYARRTLDHNPKHSKGILTRINTTQEWEEIERKFQWQKCSSRKDASFILNENLLTSTSRQINTLEGPWIIIQNTQRLSHENQYNSGMRGDRAKVSMTKMFLSKSSTLVWNWKSAHIYESSDKYARRTMDHNPKHSKGILTRINTTQEWEEIERKFQWQKCSSRKDASFI